MCSGVAHCVVITVNNERLKHVAFVVAREEALN